MLTIFPHIMSRQELKTDLNKTTWSGSVMDCAKGTPCSRLNAGSRIFNAKARSPNRYAMTKQTKQGNLADQGSLVHSQTVAVAPKQPGAQYS